MCALRNILKMSTYNVRKRSTTAQRQAPHGMSFGKLKKT